MIEIVCVCLLAQQLSQDLQDVAQLPPYAVCESNWGLANDNVTFLLERKATRATVDEAMRAEDFWSAALDARNDSLCYAQRLEAVRYCRRAVGHRAWVQQRWPNPVPSP